MPLQIFLVNIKNVHVVLACTWQSILFGYRELLPITDKQNLSILLLHTQAFQFPDRLLPRDLEFQTFAFKVDLNFFRE